MPTLTDKQREFYQSTLEVTRAEVNDLKDLIEEELSKVKERIADLTNAINAAKQMYAAACNRLGVENDLAEEDDDQS